MKITTQEKSCPVIITLENQAEIDAIFAAVNHKCIGGVLEKHAPSLVGMNDQLYCFVKHYENIHSDLIDLMK